MTDSTQDDDIQPGGPSGTPDPQPETGQTDPKVDQDALADDWAAALAEQEQASAGTQAQSLGTDTDEPARSSGSASSTDDDWAAALAEQTAAETDLHAPADQKAASEPRSAAAELFQPLSGDGADGQSDIDLIRDIPVQMSVELGRTRLTIQNILQLGQGSVVELDGLAGEPMDIYVNGYLIAQGEVVVVDDKYGIRITDIITPSDRIQRLHSTR